MKCRWLMLTVVLCAACSRQPPIPVAQEPPKPVSKDFSRLKSIVDDIHRSGRIALYEGLPSEFWEPELREREAAQKKTIGLNGYLFYEEPLALQGLDSEQLTKLLSDTRSFQRFRSSKVCGGYHPDYCVEWKRGDASTRALICLECGEVQFFAVRKELYCDLSPEASRSLAQRLNAYQKNRPTPPSRG